jgi:hypothetical protein
MKAVPVMIATVLLLVASAHTENYTLDYGEPSAVILHSAIVGIRDVCRYTVRQDTIIVVSEMGVSMGNRIEEFFGIESNLRYRLEIAFVTRCGVDLAGWREDMSVSGDTLYLRLPEPILCGKSLCVERCRFIVSSTGSFLSSPFVLHDRVMTDLLDRMWERVEPDLTVMLRECRNEVEGELRIHLPSLMAVEHLVIRWGEEGSGS